MRIPSPMPSGPAMHGPSGSVSGLGVLGPSGLLLSAPLLGRTARRAAYHYIWQRITTETFDERSHVRGCTQQENGVRTPRGWIATHEVGVVAAV